MQKKDNFKGPDNIHFEKKMQLCVTTEENWFSKNIKKFQLFFLLYHLKKMYFLVMCQGKCQQKIQMT